MDTEQADKKHIFNTAAEIADLPERAAYLDAVCAGDTQLRAEIDDLLKHDMNAGSFMERPAVGVATTIDLRTEVQPGTQIGRYKLLQEIGEGGFGVVYMAEQREPVRRKVALKIIKPGMDTRHVIARFEAERQALAMMDHPNIARVFDGGATEAGRPYFVMELVHGMRITKYCDEARLTTDQRLELFVSVCDAVQHAHQKGVIHRDIKPSNVLVTLHGDTPVAKVIDFGVAKATDHPLTEKTVFTAYGEMIGTPLYMSPEQMAMSGLDVDTRSDIYSLGVLLYELLTGLPPFDRERLRELSLEEIRRVIREEEPPKPSTRVTTVGQAASTLAECRKLEPAKLSQTLRGELDWIVMKALEKDRTRRYETASDLAKDVQRYLDDEAVGACPPSTAYRVRKFVRRNKTYLATTSVIFVALAIGMAGVTWQASLTKQALHREQEAKAVIDHQRVEMEGQRNTARQQRDEAETQRGDAQRQRATACRNLYLAHMQLAAADCRAGQARQLIRSLYPHMPLPGKLDMRGWEWYYFLSRARIEKASFEGHSDWVRWISWCADGTKLASAGYDGTIRIWDTVTEREIAVLHSPTDKSFYSVAWSPAGNRIAAASEDGPVTIWSLKSNQPSQILADSGGTTVSLEWSPDGDHLVASVDTGDIQVWDFKGNHRPRTLRGHMSRARIARWSPDGTRIASGAYDNTIRIWDAVSGVELLAIPTASPPEHTLAWNADGTRVAARDTTTTIGIWDAASGEKVQTLAGHASQLISLGWDPVTHRIATGCAAGNIKIWDALSGEQLEELPGHQDTVRFLAWGPDGVTLASASHDRSVKLWDVPSDLPGELLHVHDGPVRALFWQHDGRELASADVDGVVRIWERALGNVTTASHAPLDAKGILAWSASAERWALVNEDNEVDIVEESTGTKARTLQCGADSIRSVAWSPSGRDIAVATHRQVDIWQLASGKKMRTLPLPVRAKHNIPELCWCPDESRLVISEGNALRIVRVDSGEIVHRTYLPPFLEYGCACWSQDARMLAIGVVDGSIEVWDAEDWRRVNVLRGHVGRISCLSWSPDRRRLASAGSDAVVRLWDVDLGREICTLNRHEGLHRCVAWSRDGHQLATGGDDGTICVYDASKGYEVADAPQLRVASAEWLAGMGDLEQALETVCDLVETYPDTQAYRTLLSEIMQKHALAGMTEEEMPENLRLLLKKHLVTVECQTATCSHFVRLAKRHIGRNEFREATADYDQAIELSDRTSSIAEIYKARAFAHFYLEHFDQALADLRKSIEYRPTDIGILTRAISPREIGACPDESFREGLIELAGDVVKLNAFSARAYVVRGLILAACGKEEDALADLRAALQSLPDENSKGSFDLRKTSREFRQLCDALAHREEGFTGLVRMRGLQPREVVPWCYGALAQCCVPRANEYQAICRGMIEQFREDESPNTGYWVAWTCVLRPEAVDNYEPVIRLAEQAVEADPESETYLDTLGVVLYRAGRAEEAVERLTEANKRFEAHDSESTSSPAYTWYFLAMAHHKLGHSEEAEKWLGKANEWADKALVEHEQGTSTLRWNRRLTLKLFREEAEGLIRTNDSKPAEPPSEPAPDEPQKKAP